MLVFYVRIVLNVSNSQYNSNHGASEITMNQIIKNNAEIQINNENSISFRKETTLDNIQSILVKTDKKMGK